MGDKAKLSGTKTCVLCNRIVIDAIFCKICGSPYHPSCASRTSLLTNGAYSKCCRPKSPSLTSQSDSIMPGSSQVDTLSQDMTNDSVSLIINKAIEGLQLGLNENFIFLSSKINELSVKVDIFTGKLDEVSTTVTDHSNRITAIEGTLHDINVKSVSSNCMSEIHDRLSRSCNLILFGFAEIDDENSNSHVKADSKNAILQLFSRFSTTELFENSKLYRVGKFTQTQKQPRPVKIVCSSTEKARELHMSFLAAKKDSTLRQQIQNMRLSWDLTKMQMEEMVELRKELLTRKQNGDAGARIVHRNGVPSIISITRYQKSTSQVLTTAQSSQ